MGIPSLCKDLLLDVCKFFQFLLYSSGGFPPPSSCVCKKIKYYTFATVKEIIVIDRVKSFHCVEVWDSPEVRFFPICCNLICNILQWSCICLLFFCCHNFLLFIFVSQDYPLISRCKGTNNFWIVQGFSPF